MDLIFLGDYWDDMWRRRQQLAWRLAQTRRFERVHYVERPLPATSLLRVLARRADRDATDRWRRVFSNRSWLSQREMGLSVLTTFAPLPPLGASLLFRTSERARDWWLLDRLKGQHNWHRPMVWVSHPQISTQVISALDPEVLWYDCTEDFTAWPGLPSCVRAQIEETDRYLTLHADVVTTVSQTLFEDKIAINENTHLLPNAVDLSIFSQLVESFPVPPDMQNLDRPVLTFVGGLNDWAHDWELLCQVASMRPDWTILLIGGLTVSMRTRQMLQSHPNVRCFGQQPHHKLPAYLVHSDVCFQFYSKGRANDTRNSQKVFLYLAAGKQVVSTRSADALAYGDYVFLADGPTDFVAMVEQALSGRFPAGFQDRERFISSSSWTARVQRVCEILENVRRSDG